MKTKTPGQIAYEAMLLKMPYYYGTPRMGWDGISKQAQHSWESEDPDDPDSDDMEAEVIQLRKDKKDLLKAIKAVVDNVAKGQEALTTETSNLIEDMGEVAQKMEGKES